ncbi:MAG: hypothetical protein CME63_12475 [Halobacteriovoraceae bacterium]|nr:hypothetical protein [Halobacteriovoraceae bacterium]MBC98558.1 hypothetical protein [Halobacteriovoraceae bacterium]|tara:strand:+ start:998 stop:1642 length:645 start_codon:yes stop_codon:yes gene_type:complete
MVLTENFGKKLMTLSLVGAMGMLASCDDDNPIAEAVDEIEETSELQQLQETWQAPCAESTVLNASSVEKISFEGNDFTKTMNISSDSSCSSTEGVVTMTGEFSIDETSADTDEVYNLDLTYQQMKITLNNETAVDIFNAVNFCGVEDWTVGEEVVIESSETGEDCFVSELPKTVYGKVEVDDSEDKMYLSAEFVDESENRPETVDRAKVYTEVD